MNISQRKNRLVFDIEANGLLSDSTEIWCISGKWIDKNNRFTLSNHIKERTLINRELLEKFILDTDLLIGHNIINYDIPMIKKFYGIDLIKEIGIDKICDTYILSQLLYPDRQLPKGCPASVYNPITRKSKIIGPHGLEAWGYRVGHKKIEIHDWREFTEDILTRCDGDVDINEKVYYKLLEEAGYDGRIV